MKIQKIEQYDTDLEKTKQLIEEIISTKADFDLLYLVNSDAGEIAIDIWRRKCIDKKLVILSKSEKITEGVREGIVSSQIIQRNTLWGEMAAICVSKLINNEQVEPYENTGMYEINRINLLYLKHTADGSYSFPQYLRGYGNVNIVTPSQSHSGSYISC